MVVVAVWVLEIGTFPPFLSANPVRTILFCCRRFIRRLEPPLTSRPMIMYDGMVTILRRLDRGLYVPMMLPNGEMVSVLQQAPSGGGAGSMGGGDYGDVSF